MDKIRLGFLGMGGRGRGNMHVCAKLPNVEITAICDLYLDKLELAVDECQILHGYKPFYTTDYKEVISRDDVDAVVITSAWESHIPLAIAAMKAGKPVAMEVGGAYSLNDCFDLVRVQEETGMPFMFLENACYDVNELLVTNMVRKGLFGEVVHCAGAYGHDLREEIIYGKENRHYRLRNYINRNCENYPTHELGPIAKILNINRGNRMVSLVSMASKSQGLKCYVNDNKDKVDPELIGKEFMQGDIVTTIIKCAHGETIQLRLDTSLPRVYDRDFTVHGTKAYYKDGRIVIDGLGEQSQSVNDYMQYMPDCWTKITDEDKNDPHGGVDGMTFKTFINCLRQNKPMPMDVYDAASWMCISCLSEASIAQGSMPQEIPDFTHGQWMMREPLDVVEFPEVDND